MDIPRPRPKQSWRDSPWWKATREAAICGLLMVIFAAPPLFFFAAQILPSFHQPLRSRLLFVELGKGALTLMPYLWIYFFALERISRQRHSAFSPSINHR